MLPTPFYQQWEEDVLTALTEVAQVLDSNDSCIHVFTSMWQLVNAELISMYLYVYYLYILLGIGHLDPYIIIIDYLIICWIVS